jgi:hypothetical protein
MGARLAELAVGGFNAKAAAVALLHLFGRPVKMDDDKDQGNRILIFSLEKRLTSQGSLL